MVKEQLDGDTSTIVNNGTFFTHETCRQDISSHAGKLNFPLFVISYYDNINGTSRNAVDVPYLQVDYKKKTFMLLSAGTPPRYSTNVKLQYSRSEESPIHLASQINGKHQPRIYFLCDTTSKFYTFFRVRLDVNLKLMHCLTPSLHHAVSSAPHPPPRAHYPSCCYYLRAVLPHTHLMFRTNRSSFCKVPTTPKRSSLPAVDFTTQHQNILPNVRKQKPYYPRNHRLVLARSA